MRSCAFWIFNQFFYWSTGRCCLISEMIVKHYCRDCITQMRKPKFRDFWAAPAYGNFMYVCSLCFFVGSQEMYPVYFIFCIPQENRGDGKLSKQNNKIETKIYISSFSDGKKNVPWAQISHHCSLLLGMIGWEVPLYGN